MTRLTSTGEATQAAISPDGKVVVYLASEDNSLRVLQVATGSEFELVPPRPGRYDSLAIAPPGDHAYFVHRTRSFGWLYRVPLLGGEPQKAVGDVDSKVAFSPDGARVAFLRIRPREADTHLVVAGVDGSSDTTVASTPFVGENFSLTGGVAWSPDGKRLAVVQGGNSGLSIAGQFGVREPSRIVSVDVETGSTVALTDLTWGTVNGLAYIADGSLIVSGSRDTRPTSQIWRVAPDGSMQRLTKDLNDYVGVRVAREQGAIVTVLRDSSSTISVLTGGSTGALEPVTSGPGRYDGQLGLVWTPDGRIVYTSATTGGAGDLWICEADGANARRLTNDEALESVPAVSPDGTFVVYRSGNQGLARLSLESRHVVMLTTHPNDTLPIVLPDGESVLFTRRDELHRLNLESGESSVTGRILYGGVPAPDGRHLVGADRFEDRTAVGLIPTDGSPPTAAYGALWSFPLAMAWTADSNTVTYLVIDGGRHSLWNLRLSDEETEKVFDLGTERVIAFAWSNDDRLAVAHGSPTSDVVMIEGLE